MNIVRFRKCYGLVEVVPDDLNGQRHEMTQEIGANSLEEAHERAQKLGWNYDYIIER